MDQILKWYTGKALTIIRDYVLPTLAQAERDGYWPKGASRKVTAALNKQAVAQKFARANDRRYEDRRDGAVCEGLLGDVMENRTEWYKAKLNGDALVSAMMFGSFGLAPEYVELAHQLFHHVRNDAERAAVRTAFTWAEDFAPVAKLVATLDSRRPVPVIVCKTLSHTVLSNVGGAMGIALKSIAVPPMIIRWEKRTKANGEVFEIAVPEIVWPYGTRHGTSRYASGDHCHACGHKIKNGFNWVPLVGGTANGYVSLWVGRDCAKNLFECEVDGEADYGDRRS